ncbi:FAD-binding oxidoreductase [Nocardia ninae]|uniref:FAD-linked oxidase n=1 Tax=Nocardia ninae NBRC 108245 TaxID=1210091 RepID=A0A511MJ97_9NOCA|nr:FAD-binding oxidoreductase [Nocardia ninae]GEM40167.1 FAD-linked oxidase [Nocardia ninae NBRC 108245]
MTDIATLLHQHLPSTQMSFEGDPDYDRARATWNVRTQFHPLGVVRPRSTAEVATVVRCAREAGVTQIAIRSGGHSIEGNGLGGRGGHALVIDLIHLDKVTVAPGARTATVEPGALLGNLYWEAWSHGELMVPGGDCLPVGVGGQATCGGYGRAVRRYGILTDHVMQVEVVTADGRVLIADEDTNSDLFWALRGSGTGSFAVITKFVLRLHTAPKAPANFSLRYRLTDIDFVETFTALQDYTLNAPTTFSPMLVIWKGILEMVGVLLTDTPAERDSMIADMRARLPRPTESDIEPMSYIDVIATQAATQTSAHWLAEPGKLSREADENLRYQAIKAAHLPEPFTPEVIAKLGELAARQPLQGARMQMQALDPASGLPADATAVKVRGSVWLLGFGTDVESGETDDPAQLVPLGEQRRWWPREAYELMYPHTVGGYIGDDDLEEQLHGRDMYASYYGAHFPRLQTIKRKYDPDNLFHNAMSIPLD